MAISDSEPEGYLNNRTSYRLTDSKPINGSARTPAGAKGKFTLNLNVAKEQEYGRVLNKK